MSRVKSFIPSEYRPEIEGAKLDELHMAKFFYTSDWPYERDKIIEVNAVCVGPKQDVVLHELEHSIEENDKVLIFYYEDIHMRWSFILQNDQQLFLYRKNNHEQFYVKPKNLYIRGCCIERSSKYWNIIGNFLNMIEMWNGNVICATREQSNNESKLFQLCNSLRKSKKNKSSISIGKSYVIKSDKNLLNKDNNYIVKSLSAVRSRVVDKDDYKKWDWNALQNLPVLFQEKVKGSDLRIHNINNSLYAKLSLQKDQVDYRYSSNFSELIDMIDISDELREFCENVAMYENNKLIGIDFLKNHTGFVVLESNPSPGWASYYSYKGIANGPVVSKILEILKSG